MKKENHIKPKPFHLLINVFHYIFLSVFMLLILIVNAHAATRVVRVGVYANKPLVYQDENGEHKGLSIDVLRFVASKEDWKLEFVRCSWSECLEMLKRGENDIQVIIAKTPERDKIYDFTSQSLYSLWAQIFIHPDSNIQSWTDLNGKNVAVYKDDFFSEMFKKLIREFGIDCNLLEVEDYQAMLELMKEKKADAGVFIQTFAEPYAIRGIVRRTPIMFNPVPIYYAFPKGKVPELGTSIDRHLKMLKEDKDSIYYHSLEKALGGEKEFTIPHWIKWALIVAPALMLLFFIVSVILRRQVKAKTAELLLKNTDLVEEISERKQAEETLRESEERLEEMVEERTKKLKDAQEQLIRKEKLSVLGQLAGGVSHELRNPLGVISNAVYYLKMILPDAEDTIKEYLETISSEVDSSTKIVSDLLDFTLVKSIDREELAITDLIAQLLEKRPAPENIEIITTIPSDIPPVFVDPLQIGQAFDNLVTNAYQAMPEGGKLTVEATAEKDKAHISFADTGSGISQENLEKLFEPLFTTKARGIGLGLAVSKNLVEANGGSIGVKSEEGKGSTFTVIIPRKESSA